MAEFVQEVRAETIPELESQLNALFLPLTSHVIRSVSIDAKKIPGRSSLVLSALVSYDDAGVALTDPFIITIQSATTIEGVTTLAQETIDNTFGVVFVSATLFEQIILDQSISIYLALIFKNDDGSNAGNNWLATAGSVITNHQSLDFNGIDTYLSRDGGGSVIVIPAGTTHTIMTWQKIGTGFVSFAGMWGDDPTLDYIQAIGSDPYNYRFRADGTTVAQTGTIFAGDVWQQTFARTRGANSWGVWVNGDNNFATSAQSTREVAIDAIGRRGGSRYWLGNITLMAIWNRNLTGTERNNLYNSGTPGDPATVAPSGLIHLWRMDETNRATFPIVEDEAGAVDLIMNNMTLANFVSDYPP